MENGNKRKFGSTLLIISLLIAYLCLYLLISVANMDKAPVKLPYSEDHFFIASFKGVVTSLQMLICIILASMRQRSARLFAYLIPAFTLLTSALHMLRTNNREIIPGLTTMCVCLIAVITIHNQIRKREKEALTDYLTGLNNRRSITMLLERMTHAGKPFGVLYIDLDDFKSVNDNYGHKVGDEVIRISAERIRKIISIRDMLSRIGGDEFILIISGVNRINEIASAISESLKQPIPVEETGSQIYVTASIGISKYPDHAKDPSELIRCSDMALYNVKASGKNGVRVFEAQFRETMKKNAYIESLAKKYLDNKSFTFAYQPQYHTDSKTLRGFETLIRISADEQETVPIQDLIDVAERSDIIFQIDSYVLKYALAEFKETALKRPELILSVNASAKHFSRNGFVELVEKALDETGFPPSCLEIEITEYCLAGSMNMTIDNMNRLRAKGIKIALDDFGTGYASLSNLSKLPVNLLKIDKSFIEDLAVQNNAEEGSAEAFISAIISMGHTLGLEVISEGVEAQNQLDILKEKKCDLVQGFIWGTPLEISEVHRLCDKTE
ncbi:bifunctional diguanylate cyclase/phosphodiesterase [Ruminococcus sp. HUN007]|uniref:putative bifunctional diguanylate cyclase/phosphodiesterase n=1 Tax=Ruminococcus sp. HUN007 TaxID=1514668 RepID=UPI0005D170CF|nr:bifunctional diguanylate cyclase/phosphodiesterase [Ruminococcus sp. HUN007]